MLDQKANDVERRGRDRSAYRSRYKILAKLSDKEAQILNRVAQETFDKVSAQDVRAKKVIEAISAQGPDGTVKPGQSNPEATNLAQDSAKRRAQRNSSIALRTLINSATRRIQIVSRPDTRGRE